MLTKLLKYEIKATGRVFLPLFLALLVFAVITRLLSALSPEYWYTPANISMAIYIFIMVGMFVMTFIMMIQRFYKNLLSDEGYLMLTLPVKPWKHIASKLLVSMMWIMASGIAAFISILVIALQEGDITRITEGFVFFYNQVIELFGISAFLLTFELAVGSFIALASGILIVYASIAIGHLFNKHKMLASFGAFIALNTLSQILFILMGSILDFTFPHYTLDPYDIAGMRTIILLAVFYVIVFAGILCAAYFTITNYILSKRLNLE